MNFELIRQNINLSQEQMREGKLNEGWITAASAARLLAAQVSAETDTGAMGEGELRQFMVVCVGMANELCALFSKTEPDFDLSALPEILKERIRVVSAEFEKKRGELETEEEIHRELLLKEDELLRTQKEFQDLRDKVEKLHAIEQQELDALREEAEEWEKKTQQLEQACREYKEQILRYEAELAENDALLANMPDVSGIASVDVLIEEAKKEQCKAKAEREVSGARIDRILCAIERLNRQLQEER